jgi:[acyl-carrier-protein] S-malonyltransferase
MICSLLANLHKQIVLSGHALAIDMAIILTPEFGKKIISKKLNVSAPFHCSLMAPAREDLEIQFKLRKYSDPNFFKQPVIPIVSNVTADQVCVCLFNI